MMIILHLRRRSCCLVGFQGELAECGLGQAGRAENGLGRKGSADAPLGSLNCFSVLLGACSQEISAWFSLYYIRLYRGI